MKLLANMMSVTRNILAQGGVTFNGKRDLYEVFGYPQEITASQHRFRYKRGDIASRIVDAYPNACWSSPPEPTDDTDTQDETPWVTSFNEFTKRIKFWQIVRRADLLAQLNPYSVILLGFEGVNQLSEEVTGKPKLMYMRAIGADNAMIEKYEDDQTNARYGLPKLYKVKVATNDKNSTKTVSVHWSRIVHIAERKLDDDINGEPYLENVWNRLEDLEKVCGSSGEMWWLNGRAGLNLNVDPEVELDVDDKENLKEQVDQYQHHLTRVLRTQGVDVKPLSTSISSPKDHAELYLNLISGTTGIPKRILMGSERGELSSNQDENGFNTRIIERRANFCEPELLDPLMERLIAYGVIVDTEFEWGWPELNSIAPKDQAEVAAKRSQAIATYTNAPNAESVITPKQFVENILEMEFRENEIDDMLKLENEEIDETGPNKNIDPKE